jgi:tetratricopeptide (TPR) repeat protein
MRISPRIVVPITLATLITAGLLFFLWTQLSSSVRSLRVQEPGATLAANLQDSSFDAGTEGDTALLHLRQGDLFALAGDWQKAEDEYKASVDAGGGVPALKKFAQAQLQRRDFDGARSTIDRLKSSGARTEDLLLLNALVLLRTGKNDDAGALLAAAGDSPQKHYALALLAIVRGQHDAAKTELAQTEGGWEPVLRTYAHTIAAAYDEFALFPEGRDIHLETLLARALAQVQECELALPLLTNVTTQQDDYRDAWIVQGFCQLTTERYDAALTSLERAYALDPEKPEIQYFLGRTYAALKDHQNAITFLQYALKNGFQPETDVRRAIGAEAQLAGDFALAFNQYQAVATASGADLTTIGKFVEVAIQADRKDAAFEAAQKATVRFPDSGKAFAILGDAAAILEKKDDARAAYEKALQLDPTLPGIKEKLVNL